MVFLDANTLIYLIVQPAHFDARVAEKIAALLAAGEGLAVSDLVRMECLAGPIEKNDQRLPAPSIHFVAFRTSKAGASCFLPAMSG